MADGESASVTTPLSTCSEVAARTGAAGDNDCGAALPAVLATNSNLASVNRTCADIDSLSTRGNGMTIVRDANRRKLKCWRAIAIAAEKPGRFRAESTGLSERSRSGCGGFEGGELIRGGE